ncbi:MAG TPA: AMP-binding protein [Spirochaetota bacterium]|nr:AMP-binding protein [Spirochaetota bacterium]HOS33853.1 AMP-binding protein [Spirochaetota bacterium]HOS56246.1 AMP-binding protein [Spirochaetota bacterium]HQF78653.1 AMP-binding protein [Spirochaetota bacterium]HQH30314.1 AMP-binding protein [Spirochaetota bacterium]
MDFFKKEFKDYDDFYNNFAINIPQNFNFAYDVSDKWACEDPDRIALIWTNDKNEKKTFSFKTLSEYANKTANFFVSIGIKKGDAVMLILKRRYEFWFSILALHKIGAICIPATHLLTKKDLVYRNNAANVKAIVSVNEENVLENIENSEKDSPTLTHKILINGKRDGWRDFDSGISNQNSVFNRPKNMENIDKNDISLLYFTSGTTGMPKMVIHNFDYPLGHVITAHFWQNVQDKKAHLTVADTGWAKAAWGKIYGQWIAGSAVFVYDYDKFIPKNMLKIIADYKITTFCAPPTIYRYLIKEDFAQYDLSNLKYCVVAGEPLNPEVYNQFLKLTGIKLMEGFGQTELVVCIATFPYMPPKPGSMGKPSPTYDIDILKEDGESCEIGEEGQIVVKLDKKKPLGMFLGYYKDPELTEKVWNNDKYYTGDIAWKDEDGYYWFVGRADDVIKSSGYRIGPFEVESALLEHPAVMECAITGVPDPDRGQIVKATIVLTKNYAPSDDLAAELQEHVKRVTAPYKYPRIIEFVAELPKTISGKIRRVEIREKS